MKLTKTYTMECCDFAFSSKFEDDCAEQMLLHIRSNHPEFLEKVELASQLMVIEKTGMDGEDWKDQTSDFKTRWMENAIRELLDNPDRHKDILESIDKET